MRRLFSLITVATLLAACRDPICGANLDYDRALKRCVCREPRVWTGEACVFETTDAGPTDRDGSVDVAGPTAPEIVIDPAAPRTADDLTVRITHASTDPRGRSIRYEYAWRRDGSPVEGVSGTEVSSQHTAKGETWAVEVTPVTDDGVAGDPAVASVVVANTPPVLRTVGLSDYRPWPGGSVDAMPGRTLDADGDPVSLRFQWELEGAPLDGETRARLALDEHLSTDLQVRVRVTPVDGEEEGEPVISGPAIIVADVTRWRPLAPTLEFDGSHFIAYDQRHERFLLVGSVSADEATVRLWEITFEGDRPRFVPLRPTGTGPDHRGSSVVYDSGNRRLLVFGGQSRGSGRPFSNSVWALDLRERGSERWTEIPIGGSAPAPRIAASAVYDEVGDAMVIVGGALSTGAAATDVWALDATPGAESWTMLSDDASVLRPVLAIDPNARRLLVIGGIDAGDLSTLSITARIRALDLDAPGSTIVDLGAEMPFGVAHGFALVLPDDNELVVFGGISGAPPAAAPTARVDLSDLSASRVDSSGEAPLGGPGAVSTIVGGSVVVWPRQLLADGTDTLRFDRLDLETGRWSSVWTPGVHAPLSADGAVADSSGEIVLFGGRADLGSSRSDDVWTLSALAGWSRATPGTDLVTARRPLPRTAPARGTWETLWVFGGLLPDGADAGTTLWSLQPGAREWTEHTLASPSPAPTARSSALLVPGCGSNLVALSGGRSTATGELLTDSWLLQCASGPRGCRWVATTPAAAVARAAAASVSGSLVVFGGETPSGPTAQLRALDVCAVDGPAWTSVTATGTPPPARYGHSMTQTGFGASRAIVFGGSASEAALFRDAHYLTYTRTSWTWDAVEVPEDAAPELPASRRSHAAMWDDVQRRLVVYGGVRGSTVLSDLWELRVR